MDKSVSIARKAGANARTLRANKRDDAVRAFQWNSHTAVSKGEVKRFDGRLIAENGDSRWMKEEV